jgi:hypothetical protein
MLPRRAVAVSLVTLLGACGPAATAPAPGPEAGRYVATEVRGRPVPAVADSTAGTFGVVLADTLELDGRGGARRAYAERRVIPALGTDTVLRAVRAAQYRLVGGRLEVGQFGPCKDTLDCLPNDAGALAGGRIALDTYRYVRPLPVVLVRVGP